MKEQTGSTYQSTEYAKMLAVGEAKMGKTCSLVAGALGVLPWQEGTGIVDAPENLHVLAFDSNALGGIQSFIKDSCKASELALKFRIYNLQDDFRRAATSDIDHDPKFYTAIFEALDLVRSKIKPGQVHAVIFSSLTGAANGILRGISGPPPRDGKRMKSIMDQNKWAMLAQQLTELQNSFQEDSWHCIWEAHLDKQVSNDKDERGQPTEKDTIRVSGSAGRSWAYNVEQVVRMRRTFGKVHAGTKCDLTHFDTRPNLDFLAGGRNFTERLSPQENDMTKMFEKLGLKIGGCKLK